jgi:hypothetical protein
MLELSGTHCTPESGSDGSSTVIGVMLYCEQVRPIVTPGAEPTMIPQLDPLTGLLPVGRYLASAGELRETFVAAEAFSASESRPALWEQWLTHVRLLEALLGREPRTWMAGSFVSSKLDPSDIDVFYGFDPEAFDALDAEDLGYIDQLCTRESCIKQFDLRIDAYFTRLPDHLSVDDLRPGQMGGQNLQAFQSLGLYDEIWQRARWIQSTGSVGVSTGSVGVAMKHRTRRGYLEVHL